MAERIIEFGYKDLREGTETLMTIQYSVATYLDIRISERGRKLVVTGERHNISSTIWI